MDRYKFSDFKSGLSTMYVRFKFVGSMEASKGWRTSSWIFLIRLAMRVASALRSKGTGKCATSRVRRVTGQFQKGICMWIGWSCC